MRERTGKLPVGLCSRRGKRNGANRTTGPTVFMAKRSSTATLTTTPKVLPPWPAGGAPAHSPEQVLRFFTGIGRPQSAVRVTTVFPPNEVVSRAQAVLFFWHAQVGPNPRQGQNRDGGGRFFFENHPQGCPGQTERLRLAIELPPGETRFGKTVFGSPGWIDGGLPFSHREKGSIIRPTSQTDFPANTNGNGPPPATANKEGSMVLCEPHAKWITIRGAQFTAAQGRAGRRSRSGGVGHRTGWCRNPAPPGDSDWPLSVLGGTFCQI